jgi:tetratricopeptide (TPR) repeat protein
MATIAEAFSLAVNCAQAGQLSEAEQICRQILAFDASSADAWHLLGVIALQCGNLEAAADSLARAVAANPADPEAANNLGIALKGLGKWDEAIHRFRAAVAIRADFAEAQYNLANALRETGQAEEAIEAYRRALDFRPTDAVIHNNLANALAKKGNMSEAIAAYTRAIDLQPTYAEAHYNLGNIYKKAERDEEAMACYSNALQLNPQYAEAYSNLGAILKDHERLDKAEACFHRALEQKPHDAELHYNCGLIRMARGRYAEAMTAFERALAIQPDYAWAHVMRSQMNLLKGDFKNGWIEYEWRWKTEESPPRMFPQPLWDGQALIEKIILLHAEQGFGDTIQFIRYASLVKNLGATVVVECPPPLFRLLASYRDCNQLISRGDDLPPFDVHASLLSLPRILGTNLDTIPAAFPYLSAEPDLVALWRGKLSGVKGFRIGINWRGRPGRGSFRQRDIPLNCFAEVAATPGVRLISLQKGAGEQELADSRFETPILDLGGQLDQENGPFVDTAAIMKNLDLVITSDTSIAHLAGALGVPVWLALSFAADWRWLLDRTDSPWYPTMRLFRQKCPGDWTAVIAEIKTSLSSKLQILC